MKKFKIRAWAKNQMVYQDTPPNLETLHRFVVCYGNNILMDYTGLNDKNGKEIYEGDICKYNTPAYVHDGISYEEHVETGQVDIYVGGVRFGSWSISNIDGGMIRDIEVIGNVYENPELLEVTNVL